MRRVLLDDGSRRDVDATPGGCVVSAVTWNQLLCASLVGAGVAVLLVLHWRRSDRR